MDCLISEILAYCDSPFLHDQVRGSSSGRMVWVFSSMSVRLPKISAPKQAQVTAVQIAIMTAIW